jgi:hypothetical protein
MIRPSAARTAIKAAISASATPAQTEGGPTSVPFADTPISALPPVFVAEHTGQGAPAVWKVVDDDTTAGWRALPQTSSDRTDHRFPLAIYVPVSAANLTVSVRFAVVDLDARRQIATWNVPGAGSNFPMALESTGELLAAVFRSPARLVLLDTKTGTVAANLPASGDADNVFFDARRERTYVSCGAGGSRCFSRMAERIAWSRSPQNQARGQACSCPSWTACSWLSAPDCWVRMCRSRSFVQHRSASASMT